MLLQPIIHSPVAGLRHTVLRNYVRRYLTAFTARRPDLVPWAAAACRLVALLLTTVRATRNQYSDHGFMRADQSSFRPMSFGKAVAGVRVAFRQH